MARYYNVNNLYLAIVSYNYIGIKSTYTTIIENQDGFKLDLLHSTLNLENKNSIKDYKIEYTEKMSDYYNKDIISARVLLLTYYKYKEMFELNYEDYKNSYKLKK